MAYSCPYLQQTDSLFGLNLTSERNMASKAPLLANYMSLGLL